MGRVTDVRWGSNEWGAKQAAGQEGSGAGELRSSDTCGMYLLTGVRSMTPYALTLIRAARPSPSPFVSNPGGNCQGDAAAREIGGAG